MMNTSEISPKSSYGYNLMIQDYRQNDVDYIKEAVLKKLLTEGGITSTTIKILFFIKVKQKFGKLKCQICGNDDLIEKGVNGEKTPENLATIEHIIPKALGGFKYNDVNFICTCYHCNTIRGLKPLYKMENDMWVY